MKSLLLYSVVILALSTHLSARQWTNTKGKKIEAELVSLEGDKITISSKGKNYTIPLASLSEEDQKFAKEEIARRKIAEQKSLAGPWKFGDATIAAGQKKTTILELSPENAELAAKGGRGWRMKWAKNYKGTWVVDIFKNHSVTQTRALLGLPAGFDPSKPTPIFIQWTSSDSKNHVGGANSYWDTCRNNGFILMAVDAHPDAKAAWSTSVFLANIKTALSELHENIPATKQSPIVVGGFSGGSKISQWMAPLLAQEGYNIKGIYIGGCNEAFFDYAMEDYKVKKKTIRALKLFASSGTKDKLVNESYRQKVITGMKKSGATYRAETYDGGHRIDQSQLLEAMKWIISEDD